MTLPVVATVAGWSAWALAVAPAEAWATALAMPITQPSAWGLAFAAIGLGLPWVPFALLAKHRSIREGWPNEGRPMVIGWLQVAGACLIVGTVIPGLASAALMPALAGLAVRRGVLLGSGLGGFGRVAPGRQARGDRAVAGDRGPLVRPGRSAGADTSGSRSPITGRR